MMRKSKNYKIKIHHTFNKNCIKLGKMGSKKNNNQDNLC